MERAPHLLELDPASVEEPPSHGYAALLDDADLRLAARFRSAGWPLALDLKPGREADLVRLPLLRPDFVRIDVRALARAPRPAMTSLVTAVRSYHVRTGALIIVAGIGDAATQRLAKAISATHVEQLGGPPPAGVVPRVGPGGGLLDTPFEVVGLHRAARVGAKPELVSTSIALERRAVSGGSAGILLGAFQHARHCTPRTARRWEEVAAAGVMCVAFGQGMPVEAAPGVIGVDLAADDPLCTQWSVVVLTPQATSALVAVDLADDGPDAERRFSFAVTHDRDRVVDSAGALMARLTHALKDGR